MSDEIFRFVIARPPKATQDNSTEVVAAFSDASQADLPRSTDEARQLIASSEYPRDLASVSPSLDEFANTLRSDSSDVALAERLFDRPLSEIVRDPSFDQLQKQLGRALAAASLYNNAAAPTQHLVDGLRALEYLRRLANGASAPHKALSLPVQLPRAARPVVDEPIGQPATQVSPISPAPTPLARQAALANDLSLIQRSIKRLPYTVVHNYTNLSDDETRTLGSAVARRDVAEFDPSELSTEGQAIIQQAISGGRSSLPDVLTEFERRILPPPWELSAELPWPQSAPEPVRGHARVAGIGDLLIVRKRLARYELGEISHVENIMAGESFSRTHTRSDETETFESVETEVSEESERELQTTTRSELSQEASETIREQLQLSAGVTATYRGPTVEVSANANVAYERATEEASRTASKFARDVVDRSVTRFSEKKKTLRTTRRTRSVEDTATRAFSNESSENRVAVYRWVDKVDTCQVVNYGRRLLIDAIVPEPGDYTRFREHGQPKPKLDIPEPKEPRVFGVLLNPDMIGPLTLSYLVSLYNVQDVEPPPPATIALGVAIQQEEQNSDESSDTVVAESNAQAPAGYTLDSVFIDWSGSRTGDGHFWEIIVSNLQFKSGSDTEGEIIGDTLGEVQGTVPISMVTKKFASFVANVVMTFARTEEAFQAWQLKTFNAIMNAYEQKLAEYNDAVEAARLEDEQLAREMGTSPITQQRFVRDEIKRLAIQTMTGRDLGDLGFSMPASTGSVPSIQREGLWEKASYIRFVEQAFEWHAMSWVFYPYFWADGAGWQDHAFLTSTDADFAQFLRAGSARAVIPVTPGFENDVLYFLEQGQPWMGGEPPTYEPGDSRSTLSEAPYVPIIKELREQLGYDFETAPGQLETREGSEHVRPTVLTSDAASHGREILLEAKRYVIEEVSDAGEWRLDRVPEVAAGRYSFAIGPLLVGPSWEVRLPTTLVALHGSADSIAEVRPANNSA